MICKDTIQCNATNIITNTSPVSRSVWTYRSPRSETTTGPELAPPPLDTPLSPVRSAVHPETQKHGQIQKKCNKATKRGTRRHQDNNTNVLHRTGRLCWSLRAVTQADAVSSEANKTGDPEQRRA